MLYCNTHSLSFIPQANAVLQSFSSISAWADQIVTLRAICAGRKHYSGMDQDTAWALLLIFPAVLYFLIIIIFIYTHTHISLIVRKTGRGDV